MAIKKATRLLVHKKYNEHCAYCGCDLEYKNMQVDHLYPQTLGHLISEYKYDDINDIRNLMPSCRKCNNHKGGFRLEVWRKELSLQVSRLLKTSTQFNRALIFGQVKITESPIVFYFEKVESKKDDSAFNKTYDVVRLGIN